MDLVRFAALLTIPAAYALGALTFAPAPPGLGRRRGGRHHLPRRLRRVPEDARCRPEDLLVANARFESTTWTTTVVGPPLGGAAIGLLGPVATVVADAVSYLLSAAGHPRDRRARSRAPSDREAPRAAGRRPARRLAVHPRRRRRCARCSSTPSLFNGLIMATSAAAGRPHARPARVRALAVRPRLRRALGRRAARLTAGPAARHPVRAAHGPGRRRDAARAAGPSAWPSSGPGAGGLAAGDRRRARAHLLLRGLQPRLRHLPPPAHGHRPGVPHAVGLGGDDQDHHRAPDRRSGACWAACSALARPSDWPACCRC